MNEDAKKFMERNRIDISVFGEQESHIYTPSEVNKIVDRYLIPSSNILTTVCIGDVVGYDRFSDTPTSIFESISYYFDSNGDGYHRRSVDMLDYSSDEIIEGLQDSFRIEPIRVREMEPGKYVINGNGLHRYTLLRIHYLQEMAKCAQEENKEKIRNKYTIPVESSITDYKKTYLRFLLESSDYCQSRVIPEIDENYRYTGKAEVTLNGEKTALSDGEFMEFVRGCGLSYFNMKSIEEASLKYESFRGFLEINFPELYKQCKSKNMEEFYGRLF